MTVAVLVLVIACVNVANMLLAQGAMRWKEIAIRLALGAGRLRVVGLLLKESLLLALLGGTLGLLLATWTTRLLLAFEPPIPVTLALDFSLDLRVVAFGVAVSLATGLIFGLAPALQVSRPDLVPALKDTVGGAQGRSRLRSIFLVGQIAVSVVLLIGAGLFVRTLRNAKTMAPGFDLEDVQVSPFVDLSLLRIDEAQALDLYRELVERLEALPAVEAATLATRVPLGFFGSSSTEITVEGQEPPPGKEGFDVDFTTVAPGYFRTLQIPLKRGRDFTPSDRERAQRAVIVSDTTARQFWPDQDPIGKRLRLRGEALEVIGVASDIKSTSLEEAPKAFMYLPLHQNPSLRVNLLLRTATELSVVGPSVRREIRELEENLPAVQLTPLDQFLGIALLPQRVVGTIAGLLGLIGLLLAGIGLYGVMAFSTRQRTREIGIRMAVGAARGQVFGLVLRQGLKLALAGVAIGLLLAFATTRLLTAMLYGVGATDPATFGAVALLLTAVAVLGSYIPARRAMELDPVVALRYE